MESSPAGPIAYFDAECVLCNAAVEFVLAHERDEQLRFAALQSPAGARALAVGGRVGAGDPATLVVEADGRAYVRSDAALRLATHLRAPWRWVVVARVVPRPVRDAVYRLVARYRHRIFGRPSACRLPSPALRARLLDGE